MARSVLIVEDERITAKLLSKQVQDCGFDVLAISSNGESAIDIASQDNPDLVLMDITLEGEIDGIEAAKIIFEKSATPVVFITSSNDDATIKRATETNPYGYCIKPIDKNELKSVMELAFLRSSMEKRLESSEQKYSTILSSIGDAVIVINPQGAITYMNPVAEYITEWPQEEVLGREMSQILHMQDTSNILDIMNNQNFQDILISRSGRKVPIEYNSSPLRNAERIIVGTVLVFRDITSRIESENQLQDSLEQLRKAMGGVIQAMAQTVEARDPYTAGHQRRVADLARAIGSELGLSNDGVEGIRMAGVIHDIGKISIPAEILSKPGRLTDVEFNLIKSHPETGFDILKNIEFPWPVAQIVHQHHERIDGSGYPLGLGEDRILPESKILAVADVVEAISSHRPYRASLGIDVALGEVEKFSGSYYDAEVVTACVRLFKEKRYEMVYH